MKLISNFSARLKAPEGKSRVYAGYVVSPAPKAVTGT